MSYFPMMIDLDGRDVLVVGGGETGRRKIEILREFGARVTLVAPEATSRAAALAENFLRREFQNHDILDRNYAIVVAAANDTAVNARVSALAKNAKIPVNVVDQPALCTFIFPAIVKDGEVVAAVSSGGRSPYVAQYVKSCIKKALPPGIGRINEEMGKIRDQAKREIADPAARRAYLRQKMRELVNDL